MTNNRGARPSERNIGFQTESHARCTGSRGNPFCCFERSPQPYSRGRNKKPGAIGLSVRSFPHAETIVFVHKLRLLDRPPTSMPQSWYNLSCFYCLVVLWSVVHCLVIKSSCCPVVAWSSSLSAKGQLRSFASNRRSDSIISATIR